MELKVNDAQLTKADKASHKIIVEGLKKLIPRMPFISEEGNLPDLYTRQSYSAYWLIGPFYGTKEFIKCNGVFTVNIALISGHDAVPGVVFTPAKHLISAVGAKCRHAQYQRRPNY